MSKKPRLGRIKPASYAEKRGNTTILPHAVTLDMTTLRNGRAQWTYTETFKRSQFASAASMESAKKNTLDMMKANPQAGLKVTVVGFTISIRGTTTREDFADRMVSEFMVWGGASSKITLGGMWTAIVRMMMAGWQP